MHHIYHTEGIILGSSSFSESSKYYFIFTKELGMIMASASGIRKMSSKLRFVLQDFSYTKIDLVKGKDFWRITSASKTGELDYISKSLNLLPTISNLARLLKRLLVGEEKNEPLFNDLISGFFLLEKNRENINEIKNIEMVLVLRILFHLGYFSSDDLNSNLITSPIEYELLSEANLSRNIILSKINRALKETHL